MSGIVGLWNRDGRPAPEPALLRMGAAIQHRGPDGEGRWLEGPFGLLHRRLWVTAEECDEIQPLAGRSGARLVMDGRLDNRDELLGPLGLSAAASDAACALAAFERWGEAFAQRLAGDFALAVLEPAARRLVLVRDPIGVRPLYYHAAPRLFAFASEIKALLAHPDIKAAPDDDGIAASVMIGARPIEGQHVTCFAGISALVAAHVLVVTPQAITVRRYWDFDVQQRVTLSSFGEYAEAFGAAFARAVRRRARARGKVAVSLSGGLDSSSVYCQAAQAAQGARAALPIAISYVGAPGSDHDERRYLEEIERQRGITVTRLPIEELVGVTDGVQDQVRIVEAPMIDYLWAVERQVPATASALGARVLLSGQWGDQVMFSSAYLADLFWRGALATIVAHAREYPRWLGAEETRVLLRRFAVQLVRRKTPAALVRPLKAIRLALLKPVRVGPWFTPAFQRRGLRGASVPAQRPGAHSAQAEALYLEVRSKYHVQCMEWNNKIGAAHGVDLAFPFLDRDLLQLLMGIPGEMQNQGGVPRALLREAGRGVIPDAIRERTWKGDLTAVVNRGVARDLGVIGQALSPDSLGARLGYLDPARIEREVRRLARGLDGPDSVSAWELADLFGLEAWLSVFLSNHRTGVRT